MTDLLTDMLNDRADTLEPPRLDLVDIVREGNRRVSRRRNALVAVGVAAAVVTAIGLPRLLVQPTPPARDFSFASAFEAGSPSYAVGSRVTIDHHTFDTGHPVQVMVQTTDGVVFIDDDGAVFASSGGEATKIGTSTVLSDSTFVLESDGTLAAWVGADNSSVIFTVYDQATGKTFTSDYDQGGSSGSSPALWAVDDGSVWLSDDRGIIRWDVATGVQTQGQPTPPPFFLYDVSAGVAAYGKSGPAGEPSVGFGYPGLTIDDVETSLRSVVELSPDGATALGYADDSLTRPALADTSTGEVTRIEVPQGYGAFIVYGWTDSDTFLAVGMEQPGPIWGGDLLTCEVSGGCEILTRMGETIMPTPSPIVPGEAGGEPLGVVTVANGGILAAWLPGARTQLEE